MTELETLKAKLLDMGATKTQIENKVIPMMLAIIADEENAKEIFNAFWEMKKNVEYKAMDLQNKEYAFNDRISRAKEEVSAERLALATMREDLERTQKELEEMEKPDNRDRIKLAEYFKRNVNISNAYQETEFVKGLANILSGKERETNE